MNTEYAHHKTNLLLLAIFIVTDYVFVCLHVLLLEVNPS